MALNKEKIVTALDSKAWQDQVRIFCFDELDSTNHWLLDQAKNGDVHAHVCIAEHQTAGVGRDGKPWLATDSKNILMSLGYRFDIGISKLSCLSLVVGIALVESLQQLGVTGLSIKWPNDVYLDEAKLAGVLIQTQKSIGGYLTIIGIGLNVALDGQDKNKITQPVAELSEHGFCANDREVIIAKIIDQLLISLKLFEKTGLSSFVNRWRQIDYLKNQKVILYQADQTITGNYMGINDEGALLIELPDNSVNAYYFGDVSVRRETHK